MNSGVEQPTAIAEGHITFIYEATVAKRQSSRLRLGCVLNDLAVHQDSHTITGSSILGFTNQ